MPNPTVLRDDALAGAVSFDWSIHPQLGRLSLPHSISRLSHRYEYLEGTVTIDLDGPQTKVRRCDNDLDFNFKRGEGLLVGDNKLSTMPIHLLFDPPIRGLGCRVCPVGDDGAHYELLLRVRLSDGASKFFHADGQLQKKYECAPFIGVRADDGVLITEASYDVFDPFNRIEFIKLGIGTFYFVKA
ncbi:MAG: hypothetical protein ABI212_07915 [Burkholderiaceae bacterium]